MQPVDASYGRQVSLVMELLQGKSTVQILCAVRGRSVRLSELRRAPPSASKKGLTASLRSLEAAKVIVRRDLSASVFHVEYELSESIRTSLATLLVQEDSPRAIGKAVSHFVRTLREP